MAEMRHEWNKMQAERSRERIARDTLKHRDRRIRELEAEVKMLAAETKRLHGLLGAVR
jgi:hypothetical protein